MKYHLAKIPGHGVDIWSTSTPKIVHFSNQSILDMIRKREHKEELRELRIELANKSARNTGTTSYLGAWDCQSFAISSLMPSPSSLPLCRGHAWGTTFSKVNY